MYCKITTLFYRHHYPRQHKTCLKRHKVSIHYVKYSLFSTRHSLFIRIFAPAMYSLNDAWIKMHDLPPLENWDGKMYCNQTDKNITYRANRTQGFMAAYTFTLVTEGWLKLVYNDKELTLQTNDLYIYSPGLTVTIIDASENYHGICLLADEQVTIESPTIHDMVHIAYLPLVQIHEPVMHLPTDVAERIAAKMNEIISYLHSGHIYKEKILQMLYAVFLLELQDAQEKSAELHQTPQRMEEIFIGFQRLLPRHFATHHDIGFYAEQLHISTVYLSRVVRQVSGRTVMDHINQMLMVEASFLLHHSNLSITQIADRLHFADTPSFSKFFSRQRGMSPRVFKERKS